MNTGAPWPDLVVLVAGTRAHAETLRDEVAAVLRPMGLRLSEEKTTIFRAGLGVRGRAVAHVGRGRIGGGR